MSDRLVRVGKIIGCHGVRGDIKVRPASDDPVWAKPRQQLTLKHHKTGEHLHYSIQSVREQGPLLVISLDGVDNRNTVEPLVGSMVFADRDALPKPNADEFWADDLIGLTVVDAQNGRQRGKVKDLLSSSGSDFLEIQIEDSKETVVVPFIHRFFPEVNLEKQTVAIDLLSDFLAMSTDPVTADRLEQ